MYISTYSNVTYDICTNNLIIINWIHGVTPSLIASYLGT